MLRLMNTFEIDQSLSYDFELPVILEGVPVQNGPKGFMKVNS